MLLGFVDEINILFHSDYPCPTADCWTYDEETKACSMIPKCATLECGATSFDITFKSELFDLEDDQSPVTFATGIAAPVWDETQWKANAPLDGDGVTYTINNDE